MISETDTARRLVADAKLRVEQAERLLGDLTVGATRNTFAATYAQIDNLLHGIQQIVQSMNATKKASK